jgi:hypothetical protein
LEKEEMAWKVEDWKEKLRNFSEKKPIRKEEGKTISRVC